MNSFKKGDRIVITDAGFRNFEREFTILAIDHNGVTVEHEYYWYPFQAIVHYEIYNSPLFEELQ